MEYTISILRELKCGNVWHCVDDRIAVLEQDGGCTYIPCEQRYRKDLQLCALLSHITVEGKEIPAFLEKPRALPADMSACLKAGLEDAKEWYAKECGIWWASVPELQAFAKTLTPNGAKTCSFYQFKVEAFLDYIDTIPSLRIDFSNIKQDAYRFKDFMPEQKRIFWWFSA